MSDETAIALDPFFLKGTAGQLFAMFVGPKARSSRSCGVLFVPPFAEELNKSRRQASLQARAFAASGHGVLLLDLFGTGDSEGDFAAARWEIWLDDLLAGARWLSAQGFERIVLWGLRMGALLAADVARQLPINPHCIVLWQPVIDGRRHVDQFLRLRVASSMASSAPGVGVRDLRQELDGGAVVEVAGYELHPRLIAQIDARELSRLAPDPASQVAWLEVVGDERQNLGVAAQRVLAAWRDAGVNAAAAAVAGVPFWSTVEITVAHGVIDRTTADLADCI